MSITLGPKGHKARLFGNIKIVKNMADKMRGESLFEQKSYSSSKTGSNLLLSYPPINLVNPRPTVRCTHSSYFE